LAEEFTEGMIKQIQPDVLILATGSNPLIPKIHGVPGKNVVTAIDVLRGVAITGKRVVIIGGGVIGAETAEYLASQNRIVTIVEMLKDVALDEAPAPRAFLLASLQEKGVQLLTSAMVEEVTSKSVIVSAQYFTKRREIDADTVVLATGMSPNSELMQSLRKVVPEFFMIGDCSEQGKILDAIHGGYRIALTI